MIYKSSRLFLKNLVLSKLHGTRLEEHLEQKTLNFFDFFLHFSDFEQKVSVGLLKLHCPDEYFEGKSYTLLDVF